MDVMFWVWLGVIIVTAIVEFATMEVVSIWFTFGAIIPFILAATGALNWIWQVVIFVVLSAVMIVSLRSVTKKFLLRNSNEKTNVDSLIGQKVRMLSRTDFETVGSVKINDVVWSAIGFSKQTIEKDEIVTILSVQGNKLVVKKDKVEPEKVEETKPKRKKNEKKEAPKRKTSDKKETDVSAEAPKRKTKAAAVEEGKVEAKKTSTKKPSKSKVEGKTTKASTTKKASTKTSSKSKTTTSKTTSKSAKNTKTATKSAANKRS